jgi:hypothetical protein
MVAHCKNYDCSATRSYTEDDATVVPAGAATKPCDCSIAKMNAADIAASDCWNCNLKDVAARAANSERYGCILQEFGCFATRQYTEVDATIVPAGAARQPCDCSTADMHAVDIAATDCRNRHLKDVAARAVTSERHGCILQESDCFATRRYTEVDATVVPAGAAREPCDCSTTKMHAVH